jgi:hypothetical protein
MELALRVATHVVLAAPTANAHKLITNKVIEASKSQLVQGSCLVQLFGFFKAAAERKIIDGAAISLLMNTVTLKTQHGAACVAIIVQTDQAHSAMRSQILALSKSQLKDDQVKGVLCLGELGKLEDLSGETQILDLILNNF